eukprot:SAG22_NODE_1225_length_5115_cov_1.965510_7_plen_387_part_00
MYLLIAAFEMANYVTRLAVPYLVPFIVREFAFSEPQRALLLNSFTPGYVLTQIPAGWAIQRWGTKRVISCNCVGIVAVMLALPVAARNGGARAVSACLVAFGVLQSSFAPALWTMKATWIPSGPERAWALMVSGFGTTLAKNIASFVTPWLAGRRGWGAAAGWYAAAVGAYACVWQLLGKERPRAAGMAAAVAAAGPGGAAAAAAARGGAAGKRPFGPRQLMLAAPSVANTFLHMQHDLAELQIMAFWAPTYYNQALGVPLGLVGRYTVWPMLCAIPAKVLVAAWETRCYRRGASARLSGTNSNLGHQLLPCVLPATGILICRPGNALVGLSVRRIRKLGSLSAAALAVPSALLFLVARHPALATVACECNVSVSRLAAQCSCCPW